MGQMLLAWKKSLLCFFNQQADQCPYFSYFFLLFDPEPYFSLLFLGKQPYYPYFLGCHVVELNKEHLKHVFLHWFST